MDEFAIAKLVKDQRDFSQAAKSRDAPFRIQQLSSVRWQSHLAHNG